MNFLSSLFPNMEKMIELEKVGLNEQSRVECEDKDLNSSSSLDCPNKKFPSKDASLLKFEKHLR